jgi:hypothetical protein
MFVNGGSISASRLKKLPWRSTAGAKVAFMVGIKPWLVSARIARKSTTRFSLVGWCSVSRQPT